MRLTSVIQALWPIQLVHNNHSDNRRQREIVTIDATNIISIYFSITIIVDYAVDCCEKLGIVQEKGFVIERNTKKMHYIVLYWRGKIKI